MKRALLGLFFSVLAFGATAKETITIVYSWTAADGPANYSRGIIKEANRLQNKYTFIFDTKPGGGGSLAAIHVRNTPNTILATASAFFVRPNFFPNESYDLSAYKEIYLQCTAPVAVTAIKYKTWDEVPQDRPITIGVSGLGTTTHLFATQIQARYTNLTVIPFKSTSESLLSVASGNTDLHVAFLGEVVNWSAVKSKYGKLSVLGIGGYKVVRGFPTLVSQGFGNTVSNISVPFHLVVPASMPEDKFNELRSILVQAGQVASVKETYQQDACVPGTLTDNNLQPWYRAQVAKWRQLSTGVRLDK
jgi:tripartite-type tricarboxylate transporter receptor subunit TctC